MTGLSSWTRGTQAAGESRSRGGVRDVDDAKLLEGGEAVGVAGVGREVVGDGHRGDHRVVGACCGLPSCAAQGGSNLAERSRRSGIEGERIEVGFGLLQVGLPSGAFGVCSSHEGANACPAQVQPCPTTSLDERDHEHVVADPEDVLRGVDVEILDEQTRDHVHLGRPLECDPRLAAHTRRAAIRSDDQAALDLLSAAGVLVGDTRSRARDDFDTRHPANDGRSPLPSFLRECLTRGGMTERHRPAQPVGHLGVANRLRRVVGALGRVVEHERLAAVPPCLEKHLVELEPLGLLDTPRDQVLTTDPILVLLLPLEHQGLEALAGQHRRER
jgi:hypothetical protein